MSNVSVKFGIFNIAGKVMTVDEASSTVDRYVFAHSTFPITTSFDRNEDASFGHLENEGYYTKKYRKSVLWDFGDGTQIEAPSATHFYTKPGKYRITCTFFDIDRRGYLNDYELFVVVKDVVPTEMQIKDFEAETKTFNVCKIVKLDTVIATLSNSCATELDLYPARVWSNKAQEQSQVNYADLNSKDTFKHLKKYQTFIENKRVLDRNDRVRLYDFPVPVKKYKPDYVQYYGSFEVDDEKNISFKFFFVNPLKNAESKWKSVSYVNPDYAFLNPSDDEKERIVTEATQLYSLSQLEDRYNNEVAKIAFVDVYLKCDYVDDFKVSYQFDLESAQMESELTSSKNYINYPALVTSYAFESNDPDNVKWILTTDTFVREVEEDEHIDKYVHKGIVKDRERVLYAVPTIQNATLESITESGEVLTSQDVEERVFDYYIPKDLSFSNCSLSSNSDLETRSVLIDGFNSVNDCAVKAFSIKQTSEDALYSFFANNNEVFSEQVTCVDADSLSVPRVKHSSQDFDNVINVYTPHKLFDKSDNLKSALKAILSDSGAIDYMTSYSENFVDNFQNHKTCFLRSLISMLQSMGEDIELFERSNFEGVNELRDFVRLLSINHTQLVGHEVKQDLDIHVNNDERGSNVGIQFFADDDITIDSDGKITKVSSYSVKEDAQSDQIIIYDKYTKETWLGNFMREKPTSGTKQIKIADYSKSWLWNLLLPKRFKTVSTSSDKAQIIDSYYEFYLLVPQKDVRRAGNFIDEKDINEWVDDNESWNDLWGKTYDCLLKILNSKIK